ncbi:putative MFS family arabinose efflux permease [Collimonas sp. PA-H2]|uniref:MFS transporter n=1 Tax=Collimonas sp. PA-H2 TaxID=1881062 RepID=UPI000BF981FF|nr:MFS transporter [Collimonas sp. PA-H2]PFH04616.1 putative MFS family arabinose efflux permease [Collimonas sp. PA-H2]
MDLTATAANTATEEVGVSPWITLLLATACGLIAANIYYAQPLAGLIAAALGLPPSAAGLIVTLTQLGYGAGLLLITPLGDLFENRRLVLVLIGLATLALLGAGLASHPAQFLVAALFVGLGSVAVQVLVPYASHMAPEAVRGRMVGNVMSGLMLGIMLARPASGFITQMSSWHMVFFLSAGLMVLLALLLSRTLPRRMPPAKLAYGALLASMWQLLLRTPVLRRRALYHAFLFAAFSLFWTTTPLLLAGPSFHLSQGGIALFALAGVAGSVAAPIAGRVADRGWSRPATGLAMLAVALAFLMTHVGQQGTTLSLGLLVAAAILLDFGVAANMTIGQRAIFMHGAEFRARLNGLYMTTFFAGGAIGSAVGGWAYAQGGWHLTSWVGFALPILALLYYATEF